jgi:GNAT superfamily N-acetyltransferase
VISHPEIEVLVAADGQDRPIGMLSFSHRPQLRTRGRVATVEELVVTANWRRKGVGKALLGQATERARVLNVQRLDLNADTGQDPGVQAFAKACGFEVSTARVFRVSGEHLKRRR